MKKCPKCNNTMSDSSAFCDKCGTSLDGVMVEEDILESISTIPTVPEKKTKKKKKVKKQVTEELDIAPASAPKTIPKVSDEEENNTDYEIKDFFKDVSDGEEILSEEEDVEIPIEEMKVEPTVHEENKEEEPEEADEEVVEETPVEESEEEIIDEDSSEETTDEEETTEEDVEESEEESTEEVVEESAEETIDESSEEETIEEEESEEESSDEEETTAEDVEETTDESSKEETIEEEQSEEESSDEEEATAEDDEEKAEETIEEDVEDQEEITAEEESEKENDEPVEEEKDEVVEQEEDSSDEETTEEENQTETEDDSEEKSAEVDDANDESLEKESEEAKAHEEHEEKEEETTEEVVEDKSEEVPVEEKESEEEQKEELSEEEQVEEKPKTKKKTKKTKKTELEEEVEELSETSEEEQKEEVLEEKEEVLEEAKDDKNKVLINKKIESELLKSIKEVTEESKEDSKDKEESEKEVEEDNKQEETTPPKEAEKEEKKEEHKEEEKQEEEKKEEVEEEPKLIPGSEVEVDEVKKEVETTPKTKPPVTVPPKTVPPTTVPPTTVPPTTAPPVTAAPIMVGEPVTTEPPQAPVAPETEPVQQTVPSPVPVATTPFNTQQIPVQQPYVPPTQDIDGERHENPVQQFFSNMRPYEVKDEDKDIKTDVSLVLGALSLVLCGMLPISLSGLLMAILSKERNKMRKIGIILNSVAVGIGVIALIVFITYISPKNNIAELNTFQGKGFSLQYDEKWKVIETQDGVRALQYNGKQAYISQLGYSTLSDVGIKCDFNTKDCKTNVYNDFFTEFEKQKKDVAIVLRDSSFELLKDDIYFATYNYSVIDTKELRGKYYLLISLKKNTAISFVSDADPAILAEFNPEVVMLLDNIELVDNSGNAGSLEIEDADSPWVQYANLRTDAKGAKKSIYGEYRSLEGDPCYWVITSGNTFYWYSSENDRNDNYYYGTFNVRTGKDAMKLVGLKEKYLNTLLDNSNGKFVASDVYGIVFYPKKWVEYGDNKTLAAGTEMKHVWIIIDHGSEGIEAQALQFKKDGKIDTDVSMYMVKVKD